MEPAIFREYEGTLLMFVSYDGDDVWVRKLYQQPFKMKKSDFLNLKEIKE